MPRYIVECVIATRTIPLSSEYNALTPFLPVLFSTCFDYTINILRFIQKMLKKTTKFGTYLLRERFSQLIESRYSNSSNLIHYDYYSSLVSENEVMKKIMSAPMHAMRN